MEKTKAKTNRKTKEAPAEEMGSDTNKVSDSSATPPSISLNDIRSVLSIIKVASTRGAFKAEELTAVGSTFDRINAFLTWHDQQLETQENKDNG